LEAAVPAVIPSVLQLRVDTLGFLGDDGRNPEEDSMKRVIAVSSIVVVVSITALLPGPGLASSVGRGIPAGLAAAIHARFGPAPLRLADSPTEHPQLGGAVAMSADGTTALVSADGAGNGKGAVYIYHVADAGSWVSSATPAATLSGTAPHGLGETLGWNVALSADGTTAFAAAPFRFDFGSGFLGAVLVFHVSNESAWASTSTPTAVLNADTGGADGFAEGGLAVSSDGMTLVVGDPVYNSNYDGAGYVFHASSESAWASTSTPNATLTNAAEPTTDAEAGWPQVAISADGTTALLGAGESAGRAGRGYLYHVASAAAWTPSSTPTAILSNASGASYDRLGFGAALSGDGTTAFLGAFGVNGYRGAVDVFHVLNANLWISSSAPAAILTNGGAAKNSYLGTALAASADGTTVVAGADGGAGAADVFRASAEDAWTSSSTPTAALTDSSATPNDLLGVWGTLAASSDGATVLLGAPGFNWSTGKVDAFHVAGPGSWVTSSTPTATLTNSALPKPRCVVPRITGQSVRWAKEFLAEANCQLGKVKKVHSTKKNRRLVVSQSPAPRRNLSPGSKVNVKIGK
jgi:hypothetical protein